MPLTRPPFTFLLDEDAPSAADLAAEERCKVHGHALLGAPCPFCLAADQPHPYDPEAGW